MLRLDNNIFSKRFIYSTWLLMSFQAGYVNVGGFFVSGNFVSHVTGTSSQIGMNLSLFNIGMLLTFVTLLVAYITGAAFAGNYIGRKREEGREPKYILVLAVKAFLFACVFAVSDLQHFEIYINTQETTNLIIIFLLSFACGIQNATCALSTDGFLKPTHMTGLSTDIGIFFYKIKAWKNDSKKYDEELSKNLLRISILFSFIFGGAVAALIFSENGHYVFLFPFLSSVGFLIMAIARKIKDVNLNEFVFKSASRGIFATLFGTILMGVSAAI